MTLTVKLCMILFTPSACEKGLLCRATWLHIVQPAKWHDNTNKWLRHIGDAFTFLYRTALLSFLRLAVGLMNLIPLLLKGQTSSFTPKGEHLIKALFPHLPKCCRYEHNGNYLTSSDRSFVYNVRLTFAKNWDLFLIFKTRKWESQTRPFFPMDCQLSWDLK